MEVDSDDDPVVAEYNVYITPELKEQLYLLQYPTRKRQDPFNAEHGTLPTEMRVKPKTGFLEVDIGITPARRFDKLKGLQWGQALKHAKDAKAKGFGLSSGFGRGNELESGMKVLVSGSGSGKGKSGYEDPLNDFEAQVERGGVLMKQTFGGTIKKPDEGRPYYMAGTFRGNELHLTEITGIVQMRPQFHHIDAQAQLAKTTLSRNASKSLAKPQQPVSATALAAQRIKAESDTQVSTTYEATEKFLDAASDENWVKLGYRDEEDVASFELFDETMILKDVNGANELKAEWNATQYLDAINRPIIEEKKATAKKAKSVKKPADRPHGPVRK
ncbi:hypothetical protein, variant [Verruconis gallopava]|nr:hypothetical protein, variant [Verruconis gallopava]KIW01820.1 hypothetical protein, variant [Verruconis gallopava]